MQAEDIGEVEDLPAFVIEACVRACEKHGRAFTEKVMASAVAEMDQCRDERGKLAIMRLLAKVESLLDQQPLPLERERAP